MSAEGQIAHIKMVLWCLNEFWDADREGRDECPRRESAELERRAAVLRRLTKAYAREGAVPGSQISKAFVANRLKLPAGMHASLRCHFMTSVPNDLIERAIVDRQQFVNYLHDWSRKADGQRMAGT